MTRQKKEIIGKIEAIMEFIDAEDKLGSGFGNHDDLYDQIDDLNEKLAKLRHYRNAEEMEHDERGWWWIDNPWCPAS